MSQEINDEVQEASAQLDAHLETCSRCKANPILMCPEGYELMDSFHMALYYSVVYKGLGR